MNYMQFFLKNTMTNSNDITGHVTGRGLHKQADWPYYIWREVFYPPTPQKDPHINP